MSVTVIPTVFALLRQPGAVFVQQWMSRKFSDYRAGGQLRVLLEDGRLLPPLEGEAQ